MICVFHSEDFPLRRLTAHVRSVPSGPQRYNQLFSPLHNTNALPSFFPSGLQRPRNQSVPGGERRGEEGRLQRHV